MLSAATAALLAAPLTLAAHADTTITNNTKTALDTTTAGNITIQAGGGVEIKAASPAVTIDTNSFLENLGGISNVTGSSIAVEGDESNVFTLVQGTTIDGDVIMAGSLSLTRGLNSTVAGDTAMDIEGNLQGNVLIAQGASVASIGNQARGFVILGPISPCVNNAGVGYT